jgi:hypothetical protein
MAFYHTSQSSLNLELWIFDKIRNLPPSASDHFHKQWRSRLDEKKTCQLIET